MQVELVALKSRTRRAYEWGRIRCALGLSVPTLLVGVCVAALVREVSWPLTLGALLYLASVVLLWVGKAPGRSVLPGIVYGLLPLTGGLIARFNGHVCLGGLSCYSSCLLYCVAGGVAAGLLVARLAIRSESPTAVFMSAAATSLLTGAIGISCVGIHGLVGMALGVALGAIPLGMRRILRRA